MSRLLRVNAATPWVIAFAWVVVAEGGVAAAAASAQSAEPDPSARRWFIGSSLFVLANVTAEDSPSFYQLNIGYWLTERDVISLEMITWRYTHPLGIPYHRVDVGAGFSRPGST